MAGGRPKYQDGAPVLVLDVLETYFGRWYTLELLEIELFRLRPGLKPGTIRRAVYRLAKAGEIERRESATGRAGFPTTEYRAPFRSYLEEVG
ncbi:MAG: hypothetical protein EP299_01780 [Acidobacteria bacterium]|nr:MAG: hypothetical protein EP299_01780 [Acidobacteriota bacterium]